MDVYTVPSGSVVHEVNLHLDRHDFPPVIDLTQYDTSIPLLAVNLWAKNTAYTIPDKASVSVRMAKPDGLGVYNPALGVSENKHTVYISITAQMTAAAGEGKAIIEIINGGGIIGSGRMVLHIAPNPVTEGQYESSDEYKTLADLIKEAQDAADRAKASQTEAKKSQDEAKKSETAASTSAQDAKDAQAAASTARDDAEAAQRDAANSATKAAGSATAASESADNAAQSESEAKAAQKAAETAKNEAVAAKDSAEDAQTAAENAKNEATKQAGIATDKAEASATSAKSAADSATDAQSAQQAAETASKTASTQASAADASAKAAAISETNAAAWEKQSQSWAVGEGYPERESQETENSKAYAQKAEAAAKLAQSIAQGAKGYYIDDSALTEAHPTGSVGDWAIVGSTDTIWLWDDGTDSWTNSGNKTDLSQYYTKTESDAKFETLTDAATHAKKADVDAALAKKQDTGVSYTKTESDEKYATQTSVTDGLGTKQDKLTFDDAPKAGSKNPVTSDGIHTALSGIASSGHTHDDYVKKTGDTVTGILVEKGGTYAWRPSENSGKSIPLCLGELTFTGSYNSQPCVFELSSRNQGDSATANASVILQISFSESAPPADTLKFFYYSGNNTEGEKFYLHRAGNGAYRLYYKRSRSWDGCSILRYHLTSNIIFNPMQSTVDTLPSGAVQATWNPFETKPSHTHNYAGSTSAGGAANSVAHLLKAGSKSYNGSAEISLVAADVGAAASGHTHNYAGSPSAGGAANSVVHKLTAGSKSYNGSADITLAAADVGALASNGKAVSAGTADKLSTARTFPAVNLAGTGTASFDGSANPSALGVSGILPVAHGGTGNSAVDSSPVDKSTKMITSGGVYTALAGKAASTHSHAVGQITGVLPTANGGTGNANGQIPWSNVTSKPAIPAVVNNLTTTATGSALDASQGKALKDSITALESKLSSASSGIFHWIGGRNDEVNYYYSFSDFDELATTLNLIVREEAQYYLNEFFYGEISCTSENKFYYSLFYFSDSSQVSIDANDGWGIMVQEGQSSSSKNIPVYIVIIKGGYPNIYQIQTSVV